MLVQMDARSVFSTIFRQIWKFLAIFVPIVLIALIYVLTATPQYESSAKLLVKFGQDARPDMAISQNGSGLSAEERRGLVQSNVNILTSRDLLSELLVNADIKKVYPSISQKAKDNNAALNAGIRQLGLDLKTTTESDAGIIEIGLSNKDPQQAKLLLEQLVGIFIQKQSEIYGNPQAEVIREQADAAYKDLEEANKELFVYKTKVGVSSIDEEMTLLLNKRSNIAEYLSKRQNAGTLNAEKGNQQDPSLSDGASTVTILPAKMGENGNVSPFPALEDIQARIDELRSKEIELLQTYKPNSQIVKNLRKNIAAETALLNSSVQSLTEKLTELDNKIVEMNEYKAIYDGLMRKVQLSEEKYKTAQTRLQAAEVNNDLNQRKITQISVLEQPAVPDRPAKPNKTLTMLLAIIVAGALGVGVCLISELLDLRFTYPEQLAAYLREPLLASFSYKQMNQDGSLSNPSFWEISLRKFGKYKLENAPIPASINVLSQNNMGVLFQSLSILMPDQGGKIIYLASAYAEEGTSTIGREFAKFLSSEMGKNVLLIDYSEASAAASLLDVVINRHRLEDAIKRKSVGSKGAFSTARLLSKNDNLQLLANISEFERMLTSLKSSYDYIIVPASQVIAESTHMALSKVADGTLFVVEAEKTRAPVAVKALDSLRETGAKIVGVIFNKRIYYIPRWLYRHI